MKRSSGSFRDLEILDGTDFFTDLTDAIQGVMDVVKAESGERRDLMEGELRGKIRRVRERIADARERGVRMVEGVGDGIVANPFLSVMGAFAFGYLAGKVFGRR